MSGNDKVTIYDISKRLNISTATVSRALNGNLKVSAKMREAVLKTAEEMNYKQNRLAQALKSGMTNNVGVVVPYLNRSFFSSVIRGIEEELTPHGYHVIICQSHEEFENEVNQIDALLNAQVDAIFMSASKTTENFDHIKNVIKENTPFIFFDRKLEIAGISSVVIDDYKAGFMATEHLINQGCKRIAHLTGESKLEIYNHRYEGYRAALIKHSLEYRPEFVIKVSSKIKAGVKAIFQLWNLAVKPDAIFAAGDYVALGAIQELKKRKIKIPDEVCVVGFSNEPFTKYMELPISSVGQTPILMGKIAAQVFLEKINGRQTLKIEKKVVLSPELFVRNSSDRSSIKVFV